MTKPSRELIDQVLTIKVRNPDNTVQEIEVPQRAKHYKKRGELTHEQKLQYNRDAMERHRLRQLAGIPPRKYTKTILSDEEKAILSRDRNHFLRKKRINRLQIKLEKQMQGIVDTQAKIDELKQFDQAYDKMLENAKLAEEKALREAEEKALRLAQEEKALREAEEKALREANAVKITSSKKPSEKPSRKIVKPDESKRRTVTRG